VKYRTTKIPTTSDHWNSRQKWLNTEVIHQNNMNQLCGILLYFTTAKCTATHRHCWLNR